MLTCADIINYYYEHRDEYKPIELELNETKHNNIDIIVDNQYVGSFTWPKEKGMGFTSVINYISYIPLDDSDNEDQAIDKIIKATINACEFVESRYGSIADRLCEYYM